MKLMVFRHLIVWLLALLAFLWGAWWATRPPDSGLNGEPELVRPGILHRVLVDRTGPHRINILEIDLRRADLEVATARAGDRFYGRETVSSIAARKSDSARVVVAAVNGDYFNLATGEAQNNQVAGGVFVKAFLSPGPRPEYVDIPNSQFAMTDDSRPLIEQFMFQGAVIWGNGSVDPLSGVNVVPRRGGLTLFNNYIGQSSPAAAPADSALHLPLVSLRYSGDTLVCVCAGPLSVLGSTPLSADRLVLAGYRASRISPFSRATRGDTIRLVLALQPERGRIVELIGGWPRLVRNGKSIFRTREFPENPATEIFARRHPRTGAGFSRDGNTLYFITVDGRQENSAGMSLPEFADLMVSIGIAQGLNLDGGGSTTMVINGEVVNSPSDPTGDRAVGNCLLVYARIIPRSTSVSATLHH